MGKKSSYPGYSTGSVKVNGRTVATSYKNGNSINTNYNMSDLEKETYNKIQSGMSDSISNLLSVSEPQRQAWNDQLDAIAKQGIQNIENIYTPMETNLKNDIASRFGNFDNSVFMDKLSKITDNKAQAVADLTTNLQAAQDSLYANELSNRINIITLLNNLNSAMNNNMLNYTSAAAANSASGNNYNQNAYAAQNNNMLSSLGSTAIRSLGGSVGNPYMTAANFGLSFLS